MPPKSNSTQSAAQKISLSKRAHSPVSSPMRSSKQLRNSAYSSPSSSSESSTFSSDHHKVAQQLVFLMEKTLQSPYTRETSAEINAYKRMTRQAGSIESESSFKTSANPNASSKGLAEQAGKTRVGEDPDGTSVETASAQSPPEKYVFCYGCCNFRDYKEVDLDHVFPSQKIKTNQKLFMSFLQKNSNLSQALTAHTTFLPEKDQPRENHEYFYRHQTSSSIGMTAYFYKVCYTDPSNLSLICHFCNLKKSSQDPLSWLRGLNTFSKFDNYLKEKGGLQEGLFINKVFKADTSAAPLVIGSRRIAIPRKDQVPQGLGDCIEQWLNSSPDFLKVLGIDKKFCSVVNQYRSLLKEYYHLKQLWCSSEGESSNPTAKQQLIIIKIGIEILAEFVQGLIKNKSTRSFTAAPSVTQTTALEVTEEKMEETMRFIRWYPDKIQTLTQQLCVNYDPEFAERITKALTLRLKEGKHETNYLDKKEVEKVIEALLQKLPAPQTNYAAFSNEMLDQVLNEAYDKHSFVKQKQRAEQKAEQAEQKAEQAEQKAKQAEQKAKQAEQKTEEAEQKTQAESAAREQAEQRAEQAEREAAALRQQLQLSQQSVASSSVANATYPPTPVLASLCGSPKEEAEQTSAAIDSTQEPEQAADISTPSNA